MAKSDLSPARLAELRAIAEEATRGPWASVVHPEPCAAVNHGHHDLYRPMPDDDPDGNWGIACHTAENEDAAHIAAFDPPTVLALLDEIARLRTAIGDV